MTLKIASKTFSGLGKLSDGTLARALGAIAQAEARRLAASLSDLTNNSGGTNDTGGIRLPAVFTPFEAGTGDAVAKAEFETACGGVRDAIKEIVAKAEAIRAKVPAFDAITDSMGGTAADGTIGAIDDSMTGTDAAEALVSVVGANAVFATLNARMSQATRLVNKLRKACGMAKLASELPTPVQGTTFAAVSTSTGDAVGGTDDEEDATISKVAADAALDVMSDNIATLATALNAMTADANGTAAVGVVIV